MKFVFLSYINTPEFTMPGDWIRRIRIYTGVLESLSSQHTVVSIEQINYEGEFPFNGVQYHFLNFGNRKSHFPFRLNGYVKKLAPDVVLVHSMNFPLQVIQLRLKLGRKTKIIVQNHAEKPRTGYKKLLQKAADRVIDSYLFTSKEMGNEWVIKGIIKRPQKVNEVMEASSVFAPMDRISATRHTNVKGDPVFLWVGRLDRNKDPLTVIKSFLKFVSSFPAARLYMVFHTTELLSEIESLLGQQNVHKDPVVLAGRKSHEEMSYWYNSADFILSGSHYEGSGVAVCEAMSCGCIPIITNILSFKKMTGEGKCGLLYEPGNEQALLSALRHSMRLNIKEERKKVLQQFREALSFEAISRKIHRVAESL